MGTWNSDGTNTRTISVAKTAKTDYTYGDDEHGSSSSSERSFACLKNNTEFQHSFEFETPEWITSPRAVSHSNGNNNYYNLKFNIAANTSDQRTGNIVIKCNGQSLTLTVVQAGESAPTGFILYMNSDLNYSDILDAIKVNGNSITPPTSKSIQIFTSATPPSTNPGQITIEIQPSNPSGTSKTFYLSFNTNTSYNNDNIVYNNFTGQPDPLPSGLSAFQYLTANNTVQIKVDNNNLIWEDMVNDVSCGQMLYEPENNIYPTINIYISNQLVQSVTEFALFIVNENPGGNRHFGTYFTLSRDLTPYEVNFPTSPPYVKLADRMDKTNIHIDTKYLAGNEESLRQAFSDGELSDSYCFYIAPVGTEQIDTTRTEQQLKILPSSQFTGLNLVAYQSNSLQLNINNGNLIPVFTSGAAYTGDTIHIYDSESIQIYCSCEYYGLPSQTMFIINYSGNDN